jgi:hypothetical protein
MVGILNAVVALCAISGSNLVRGSILPRTEEILGSDGPFGNPVPPPGADGKYTLQAEGIRAQFVPYGAAISNLFIKDKTGVERDVVIGWDNATYYTGE